MSDNVFPYLLAGLSRKVEHQNTQEGDEDCGQDQVDGVEQGLPSDGDVEGDVCLRRVVGHHVEESGHLQTQSNFIFSLKLGCP